MKRLWIATTFLLAVNAWGRCYPLSIFFKMPGAKGCTDPWGHVASALGSEVFDYGPLHDTLFSKVFGDVGIQYWAHDHSEVKGKLANIIQVRKRLRTFKCAVVEMKIWVNRNEAYKYRDYWQNLYRQRARYFLAGRNCVRTIVGALNHAEILTGNEDFLFPMSLYRKLHRELESTCGDRERVVRLLNRPTL